MLLSEIFITGAVTFAAFFTLGLSGFGSALVMIPILTLFLDIKLVVTASAVTHIVILSATILRQRSRFEKRLVLLVSLGSIAGVTLGTTIFVSYSSVLLKKIFGASLILFLLTTFRKAEHGKPMKMDKGVGVVAGIISGLVGALFGTAGPPVVLYFNRKIGKKEVLRSSLLYFFLLTTLWRIANYTIAGAMNTDSLTLGLSLIPPAAAGITLGSRTHFAINESLFRKTLTIILLASGISLLAL